MLFVRSNVPVTVTGRGAEFPDLLGPTSDGEVSGGGGMPRNT